MISLSLEQLHGIGTIIIHLFHKGKPRPWKIKPFPSGPTVGEWWKFWGLEVLILEFGLLTQNSIILPSLLLSLAQGKKWIWCLGHNWCMNLSWKQFNFGSYRYTVMMWAKLFRESIHRENGDEPNTEPRPSLKGCLGSVGWKENGSQWRREF